MKAHSSKAKKEQKPEEIGFIKRLFSGTHRAQRKTFRTLKRELSHAKIDLYKIKHDIVQPAIARIFYEIYKLTYPFRQTFIFDMSTKRFLPSFDESFITFFHSEAETEIYKKLSEENIRKLVEEYGVRKTTTYLDKLMNDYLNYFDMERTKEINAIYTNLIGFAQFTKFDFYPILREFDESLEEENFLVKPNFQPVDGALLREELLKLHHALFRFTVGEGLDQGIEIVAQLKNVEPISRNAVHRLKRLIKEFQDNQYVSLIVRAIDMNPAAIPIRKPTIVEFYNSYAARKKRDVQNILHTVKESHRDQAASSIINQLFGDGSASRLKNFNETKNDQLDDLGLPLFEYVKPLNYTKAFTTDRYNGFIRNIVNELIIAGAFNNKTILNNLSNNYYALNNLIKKIDEFDDDLDIDGSSGSTFHRFMQSVTKDKSARSILVKTIDKLNRKARLLITEEIVNIKEMAFIIKKILDEYKSQSPTIIYNIKKIRSNKNKEFIQDLVNSYKYIYLFLRLMGSYISLSVTRDEVFKQQSDISNLF